MMRMQSFALICLSINKGDITKLIGDRQTRTKGQLTEKIKQKPYSVILIDEIGKAHSEVVDLFCRCLMQDV